MSEELEFEIIPVRMTVPMDLTTSQFFALDGVMREWGFEDYEEFEIFLAKQDWEYYDIIRVFYKEG